MGVFNARDFLLETSPNQRNHEFYNPPDELGNEHE